MAAKALLFAALLVQCIYLLTAVPIFGSPLAAAEFPYAGGFGPFGYGPNAFGWDGIAGPFGFGTFGFDATPFGYDGIAGPYGFGLNTPLAYGAYGFGPNAVAIL